MERERPKVDVLVTAHVPIIYDDDIRWISNWGSWCSNQSVWRHIVQVFELKTPFSLQRSPTRPNSLESLELPHCLSSNFLLIRYPRLVLIAACWARTSSPNVGEHDFRNQNWLWLDVEYTAQPHSHRGQQQDRGHVIQKGRNNRCEDAKDDLIAGKIIPPGKNGPQPPPTPSPSS